jgi:uncharacterized damage-inducible protein DinB
MVRAFRVLLVALVCLTPSLAAGQSLDFSGIKLPYDNVKGWITKAAADVTQENYGFKPTPEVRTLGQVFGHIANANFMICSAAAGEKSPATSDAEKLTAKADIEKAVADSFAYCDKVWAQVGNAGGSEPVEIFGMKHTRLSMMSFNGAHDMEHYGNIVTYLRLKGLVPPSSQGGGN